MPTAQAFWSHPSRSLLSPIYAARVRRCNSFSPSGLISPWDQLERSIRFVEDLTRSADDGLEEVIERYPAVRRFAPTFLAAFTFRTARSGDPLLGAIEALRTMYLPAALEATETPPSPIGRLIIWTIIAAALGAITWACLAHVDTIAVAEGRLVPEGRLRSVEASEHGVIRAIMVKEGQHVTKGQPLIYLDPTIADAEASTARNELATARLTRARDNALLADVHPENSSNLS